MENLLSLFNNFTNEELKSYVDKIQTKISSISYKGHYDSYDMKSLTKTVKDFFYETYQMDLFEIVDKEFEEAPGGLEALQRVREKVYAYPEFVNRTIKTNYLFWRPIYKIWGVDSEIYLNGENFILCRNERHKGLDKTRVPEYIDLEIMVIGPDCKNVIKAFESAHKKNLDIALKTGNKKRTNELKEYKKKIAEETKKTKKSKVDITEDKIKSLIDTLNDKGKQKILDYLEDLTSIDKYKKE